MQKTPQYIRMESFEPGGGTDLDTLNMGIGEVVIRDDGLPIAPKLIQAIRDDKQFIHYHPAEEERTEGQRRQDAFRDSSVPIPGSALLDLARWFYGIRSGSFRIELPEGAPDPLHTFVECFLERTLLPAAIEAGITPDGAPVPVDYTERDRLWLRPPSELVVSAAREVDDITREVLNLPDGQTLMSKDPPLPIDDDRVNALFEEYKLLASVNRVHEMNRIRERLALGDVWLEFDADGSPVPVSWKRGGGTYETSMNVREFGGIKPADIVTAMPLPELAEDGFIESDGHVSIGLSAETKLEFDRRNVIGQDTLGRQIAMFTDSTDDLTPFIEVDTSEERIALVQELAAAAGVRSDILSLYPARIRLAPAVTWLFDQLLQARRNVDLASTVLSTASADAGAMLDRLAAWRDTKAQKREGVAIVLNENDQTIRFRCGAGSQDVIRFEPDGKIFVRGELATEDAKITDALREFLTDQSYIRDRSDPAHVDVFIDDIVHNFSAPMAQRYAAFWFYNARLTAMHTIGFKPFLDLFRLFCTFDGVRYRVTGASRMGDIWLAKDFTRDTGYDLRVAAGHCSEWGWQVSGPVLDTESPFAVVWKDGDLFSGGWSKVVAGL